LVEERDGGYYPAEGHEQRFAEYLEQSGCNAAEQRQRDRIERERLAYELHGTGQKIVQDFHDSEQPGYDGEQPGYDPGESGVPELVEPLPEIEERHSMLDAEATDEPTMAAPELVKGNVPAVKESAVDDDWTTHEIPCECVECLAPMVSYASPKPLPGDSGRPRIAPLEPIRTYVNPGDSTDRQRGAA
jgi:hypothetical protein